MLKTNYLSDKWLEKNRQRLPFLDADYFHIGIINEKTIFLGGSNLNPSDYQDEDGYPRQGCYDLFAHDQVMDHLSDGERALYSKAVDLKVAAEARPGSGPLSPSFARAQLPSVISSFAISKADNRAMSYMGSKRFNELQARCLREREILLPKIEAALAQYIEPAIADLTSEREEKVRLARNRETQERYLSNVALPRMNKFL